MMLSPNAPDSYINKRLEIIDDEKCLCRGFCKSYKNSIETMDGSIKICFVTLDGKYFFNANSSLIIRESDGPDLTFNPDPNTELMDWRNYSGENVKVITDLYGGKNFMGPRGQDCDKGHDLDTLGHFPKEGRMYEIRDKNSGEILARGPETKRKVHHPRVGPMSLVSVDGKWFFNERYDGISVSIVDGDLEPIPFTKMDEIPW